MKPAVHLGCFPPLFSWRRWLSLSLIPAAVLTVAGANPTDWSSFRGPGGMGVSSATQLPVEWNRSTRLVWTAPLPGAGASSPIVSGDRIYITAYTGFLVPGEEGSPESLQRHLLALDRRSGKTLWDVAVPAKLPEENRIREHGFAASTPAADGERVYAFFGKNGVIAFDPDGKQLWQVDVGSKTHGWGSGSSPTLFRELVFINASVESESLFAMDRRTGKEVWRAEGIRESWNTPVLVDSKTGRKELILAVQGQVKAFDPATGKELWWCKTDIGWYMVPSVVAHDGVVYCLGGRSGIASLAVKTGGEGDVTATHRLWTSSKGSNVSSPVYHEGHLYWMHDSRGIAYCLKADSGELVYEQRLERADASYASSVLAGGKVYYLARNGRTFVVKATPTFELLALNELGDRSVFNGSPAIDGDRLLIRSDKFLYCIGR